MKHFIRDVHNFRNVFLFVVVLCKILQQYLRLHNDGSELAQRVAPFARVASVGIAATDHVAADAPPVDRPVFSIHQLCLGGHTVPRVGVGVEVGVGVRAGAGAGAGRLSLMPCTNQKLEI